MLNFNTDNMFIFRSFQKLFNRYNFRHIHSKGNKDPTPESLGNFAFWWYTTGIALGLTSAYVNSKHHEHSRYELFKLYTYCLVAGIIYPPCVASFSYDEYP